MGANVHPQGRFLRVAAALRSILIALAFLVWWHGPAHTHATLMNTDPADGAVVAVAPSSFRLTFNEPVAPLRLALVAPDGAVTGLNSHTQQDQTIAIELPSGLGEGTHVLTWRVVSQDGHPVGGAVIFSIGAPGAVPDFEETGDPSLRVAIWISRVALYIGLFFGAGGAFALAWLVRGDETAGTIAFAASCLGAAAAIASVGLQGLDAMGAPLSHIANADHWRSGLATSHGTTASIALLALLAALLAIGSRGLMSRLMGALALGGAGLALAASGHASAAAPQWLMRPAVFVHGVGVAFWAGALVPLAKTLSRHHNDAPVALARFSRAIPWVLGLLLGAGTVLAAVQAGSVEALASTAYGNILAAKLALIAALLALAAFNRWRLTAPATRAEAAPEHRLARMITLETLLIIAILALAAGWRFTPPPRALAIAAAKPVSIHIHEEAAMADLVITPGRAGPVEASIVIMSGDFGALDAREVTLHFSMPGSEPVARSAHRPGDGTWRVDDLVLPAPGQWNARIEILADGQEHISLSGSITIKR